MVFEGDLLEMMLTLSKENEQLRRQLEETEKRLNDRKIAIEKSGSLAEAALQLNGLFETAQAACDQYTQNIQYRFEHQEQICQQMEQETKEKCARMLKAAKKQADTYLAEASRKAKEQTGSYSWLTELMENTAAPTAQDGML